MNFKIEFENAKFLSELFCNNLENLKKIEEKFSAQILCKDKYIEINSSKQKDIKNFFALLNLAKKQGIRIYQSDFERILDDTKSFENILKNSKVLSFKRKSIIAKTINQRLYIEDIQKNDIVFGIGPAGTGKTYLATAMSLKFLMENKFEKIIFTRPAVEAGEALGFLPGDLNEKIQPYLQPLYDAAYDLIGKDETIKLINKNILEIAPLAYMRGRTLSNSFIILDEAQNTTIEQMMMFLTRLGQDSRMIITGDITQIDLPKTKKSGLKQAIKILKDINGIKIFNFNDQDVVRHSLVSKIVRAYQSYQE